MEKSKNRCHGEPQEMDVQAATPNTNPKQKPRNLATRHVEISKKELYVLK